ncbi:isochorismatase family protein, partial [Pseudomonas aeruginosa]|uniref:isochorismatase family protein n=1 Tax=Pseudomonas aeruginosa TaxID=287 RepID=UPI002952EE40
SATPQFRVYYWLALRDAPLEFRPDLPPTSGMGPYLAIHRLRDSLAAAGRKKVVVAGLWTEVCNTTFALCAMLEGGYEIYMVA